MSASLWQAPLAEFQFEVAAAQPAPAGVAVACVTAALAVSLLVKVLRITGKCAELLGQAEELILELRTAADADVDAVRTYIQARDQRAMQEVPTRAAHAVGQALTLCATASGSVTGLIAADLAVASTLLGGASTAIHACMTANWR